MDKPEATSNGRRERSLSRRRLLGIGAAASAAAVVGLAAPSLAGTASAKSDGRRMTVKVVDAHITLNVLPAPSATFFLVIGNITEVDGGSASGKFYCRGVFTDTAPFSLPDLAPGTPASEGLTFVEQRFRIDGKGIIIGSGDEGDPPLAVLGGTGHFTGVHGSYSPDGLPIPAGDGIIDFTFNLRRG